MKRIVISIFAVSVLALVMSCASNPGTEPGVEIKWASEAFSLNPDNLDEAVLVANININHPAPIVEWSVKVDRRRAGAQAAAQAAVQNLEAGNTQAAAQNASDRSRGAFYEATSKGKPKEWKWNGKTSREGRNDRIQSATDYQVSLTVTDKYGNTKTIEDTLSVDVLTMKDDQGNLRILVSNIVFPPNGSDLSKVSEDDQRANRRVLRLVGNALKKYDGYAVTVEGHSNPTTAPGTPEREAEEKGTPREIGLVPLSKDRAQAVADYLVKDGDIDVARLTVVGIGGERTVAAWNDEDPDERAKNRRVEFILHKN